MGESYGTTKSISDVSWASFVTKLQYKADCYGREIIKVDKRFPSSQICSECGHNDGKRGASLSITSFKTQGKNSIASQSNKYIISK